MGGDLGNRMPYIAHLLHSVLTNLGFMGELCFLEGLEKEQDLAASTASGTPCAPASSREGPLAFFLITCPPEIPVISWV